MQELAQAAARAWQGNGGGSGRTKSMSCLEGVLEGTDIGDVRGCSTGGSSGLEAKTIFDFAFDFFFLFSKPGSGLGFDF